MQELSRWGAAGVTASPEAEGWVAHWDSSDRPQQPVLGRAERTGDEQRRLLPLPLNTEAYIRDYGIEPRGSIETAESTAPWPWAAPVLVGAGGEQGRLGLVLRLGVFVVDVAAHGSGVDALGPEEDPVAGLVAVGLPVVLGVAPGGQRLAAALAA